MPGITDPTEAYFKDGQWGWDGTQWRKLPMVWGYSDRWYEFVEHTMTEAAYHTLSTVEVPAGYVYVLEFMTTVNVGTQVTQTHQMYAGVNPCNMAVYAAAASGIWQPTNRLGVTLKAGDTVRCEFMACSDGDILYMKVWGHKMKIAE